MKRAILIVLALLIVVSSFGCSTVVPPQGESTEQAVTITMQMIREYPQLRESLAFFDAVISKGGDFRLFANSAKGYFMWVESNGQVMLVYLTRTPGGELEIGPTMMQRGKPEDVIQILRTMKYFELTDKAQWPAAITAAYQAATTFVQFLTLMSNAEFVPILIPVTPDLIDPLRQFEPIQT